jgi:hypothetical protein
MWELAWRLMDTDLESNAMYFQCKNEGTVLLDYFLSSRFILLLGMISAVAGYSPCTERLFMLLKLDSVTAFYYAWKVKWNSFPKR